MRRWTVVAAAILFAGAGLFVHSEGPDERKLAKADAVALLRQQNPWGFNAAMIVTLDKATEGRTREDLSNLNVAWANLQMLYGHDSMGLWNATSGEMRALMIHASDTLTSASLAGMIRQTEATQALRGVLLEKEE